MNNKLAHGTSGFDDKRAVGYDQRVRQHIPGYELMYGLSEMLLAAALPEQASLLNVGTGTAQEMFEWAPKHPGWRFTGTDPSAAMIALARQKMDAAKLSDRVQLIVGAQGDAPEDAYDAASLMLVLHFVPDKAKKEEMLSAIANRMKPGAPFLMATLFGDPESTRYKRMNDSRKAYAMSRGMSQAEADEFCDPERKDLYIVPEERVKNLLREAGFIDIQRVFQALTVGLWFARAAR